jgi:hypothetical protein
MGGVMDGIVLVSDAILVFAAVGVMLVWWMGRQR